jgi:hypothetical protein
MLIKYKPYPWVNSLTGKEPKTGDEFLYHFYINKDEPERTFLCIQPSIHPIKKHPFGFFYLNVGILLLSLGRFLHEDLIFISGMLLIVGIISGSIFSFISYIFYYLNEKKWKKQVIQDWKLDKLRYKHSDSILCSSYSPFIPIDESKFS